ncbi:MAG: PQQ-binding-like beta-propeller repeat protein [Candidatus Bathyarchaeia archaeon]
MRKNFNISTKAISLLLIIATAALVGVSAANAQVYSKKTYGYVIASPNPVGVNQDVLLIFGLTDYLYQWPDGFEGITITVERPDGKTETLGPFKTDSTGATGAVYKPTMVGTYYFQLHFPGQNYTWPGTPLFDPTFRAGTTTYFQPCTSEKFALTVQEQPLPTHPGFPPPQEYWTRPIDSQIREWTYIAGNWLGPPPINFYAPYNQGPETPHILWAKHYLGVGGALGGGLAGGAYEYTSGIDEHGFETGDAYEGLFGRGYPVFSRSVIIGGVLYFNRYKVGGGTRVDHEVVAVDIRTGEEIWARNWNRTMLAYGQMFYWDSFNYHAVFPYLIATRTVGTATYWDFYDASTGRWVFSYSNVPSGVMHYGPKGEIIIYTFDLLRGWVTKWNSTHVVTQRKIQTYGPTGMFHGSWIDNYYQGMTLDARLGIMWNKTIPRGLSGSVWAVYPDDIALGAQLWGSWMVQGDTPCILWAIDLRPGREGQLLYNVTWQKPLGDTAVSTVASCNKERIFVLRVKETRQLYGFNMDTGRQIWGPSEPLDWRSVYGVSGVIVYGKLLTAVKFAGQVNCYDVKTGKLLWSYELKDAFAGSEMWQKEFAGDMWTAVILFVTDGKAYIGVSEHSPNNPLPRGAPFACIDVNTGEEIFRVDGLLRQTDWGGPAIIGDSIIVSMDTYDQRIYAIGKGPTQTTVEAPSIGVSVGQAIVVRGKVIDISPGTKDYRIALRFPDGVPAVADECMGEWMLYVYKQFPRPANVKGVWVKLDAVNVYTGEYIDIGGAFTDETGFFTASWQPPKEGLWKIIASFPGSKSYWPSCAHTSIVVTAPTPAPTPASPEEVQTVKSSIDAITPIINALLILVIIAIITSIYSIYDHRRLKK